MIRAARSLERSGARRRSGAGDGAGKQRPEHRTELQFARALAAGTVDEGQVEGVAHEKLFDLVGGRAGELVEDQSRGARRDRSRLGSPAAAHEAVVEQRYPGPGVDVRVGHAQALDVDAGSDEVGLSGRAGLGGGREVRNHVVGHRSGPHRIRRTDRDDPFVIGGIGERRRRSLGLVAAVAGGRDHDDSGIPCLFDGKGQGVDAVPLRRVRPIRQVEDPDVEAVVVAVLDDPVDGCDDLRHVGAAVGGGDLQADDSRVGRHSPVGRGRRVDVGTRERDVATGDEAGHEGPVTEGVEIRQVVGLGLERQVRAVDHLARAAQSGDR